ncbi:MAG: SDR family NAD(P)-dependent oxidoreductase [Stellaceae bacterium]
MTDIQNALVVGASRGLGLGLAAELKNRGFDVVATAREESGVRRLESLAGVLQIERIDINDDDAVAGLRRRLDARVFDLLFVNAGITPACGHPAPRVCRLPRARTGVVAGRDQGIS